MDLDVYGLCLGGNVFGWTADETRRSPCSTPTSSRGRQLHRHRRHLHAPEHGHVGDDHRRAGWPRAATATTLVIATKVGSDGGLSAAQHRRARRGLAARGCRPTGSTSTTRTRTTARVPVEETLRAFDALVRGGKVRHVGGVEPARGERLARVARGLRARGPGRATSCLQPHYNLVEREGYEREYAPIVAEHGLAVAPYYALAKGFLTGKYRPGGQDGRLPAGRGRAARYLDERGERGAGGAGRGRRRARRAGRRGRPGVAARPAGRRRADRQRPLGRAARGAAARGRT